MKKEKTQISKIRNAKGEITTNTKEIIRDYFESLCANKFQNFEEMDRFLDTYDHPNLIQEDINHLKRSIKQYKIEAVIKSPKKEKVQDLMDSLLNSIRCLKKNYHQPSLKCSMK
jgi:non-homologous end joining protein Ku